MDGSCTIDADSAELRVGLENNLTEPLRADQHPPSWILLRPLAGPWAGLVLALFSSHASSCVHNAPPFGPRKTAVASDVFVMSGL